MESEIQVDARRLKRLMCLYWEGAEISRASMEITDVKVDVSDQKIAISVELCRPGILIGRGGRNIDGLEEYLGAHLKRRVDIKIEESTLWA